MLPECQVVDPKSIVNENGNIIADSSTTPTGTAINNDLSDINFSKNPISNAATNKRNLNDMNDSFNASNTSNSSAPNMNNKKVDFHLNTLSLIFYRQFFCLKIPNI